MTDTIDIIPTTVAATGLLGLDGEGIITTVVARKFIEHAFTATTLQQGRVYTTAYNAEDGQGTHFGASVHGVTEVSIVGNLTGTGLAVMVCTESGQTFSLDLFAAEVEGERQPIALVDRRDVLVG